MTAPLDVAAAAREESPAPARRAKKKFYGRTAKVGAVWSVVRQGGQELIYLPASMLLARLLAPADFGIAAAASFFILLSTRLTQLGFNSALVKIKHLRDEHATSVFAVNIALGIVTWAILIVAAPFIGRLFDSPASVQALRAGSFIFLITPFGTVPSALIARRMDFRHTAAAQWADSLSGVIVSVALALSGFGFWSIVLGHLAGSVCQVTVMMYLSRWRPSARFSLAATRELLSFGLGVHIKRLLQFACLNLDTLIVGSVLGVTALGFYDKAFTLMNRFVVRLAVGGANFRIFSIIQEDPDRFRRAYLRLILTVSLIALPVFGGAIAVAPALFAVLFGKAWLASVLPFQILCVGGVLRLYDGYASHANEAMGAIWNQVRRQALGAVLVVIGAWAGSRIGGVVGAATGVTAALAVLSVTMQTLVCRVTGLTWRQMLGAQLPAAVCATGLVAVVLAAREVMGGAVPDVAAWQMLIVQLLSGAAFYLLFLVHSPFPSVTALVQETAVDLRLHTALARVKGFGSALFRR